MKKLSALIFSLFICATCAFATSQTLKFSINDDVISIPTEYGMPFYDENDKLQMPLRYILEKCGYSVLWDSQNNTVTVSNGKKIVVLTVGSNIMKTADGNITMTSEVKTRDNRTFLPLRVVLEELGSTVKWERNKGFDTVKIETSQFSYNLTDTKPTETTPKDLSKPLTAREISDKVSPAVFFIEVFQDKELYATGSGFFIDESGTAVTNYHVIESTTSAEVELTDGKKYKVEQVIDYDPELDIAVIKISKKSTDGASISKFPFVKIGNSDEIANGDKIYAIGSPEGFQNTISDGIISNKKRKFDDRKGEFIQITAPISSGSSGGLLVNDVGDAIGITNGGWIEGQNINFAIPTNKLKELNLKAYGISYEEVFIREFRKSIKEKRADFADRVYDEVEDDTLYTELENGDTYIGTFSKPSDTDIYSFYVPVPVYITVISGGLDAQRYDHDLDMRAFINTGLDWNSYVKESFRMIIESSNENSSIEPELLYDSDDNPMAVVDKVKIYPGRYAIAVFQTIDNATAWQDREYFIYLKIEEE